MILGKFTVINAGSLRRTEVRIGGTSWIPPIPVEEDVNTQILNIVAGTESPLDKALHLTLYIMRTQMFLDGNKRIAMLIGNKIMIQNGQGIISVIQKDIKEFYQLLVKYYETNDFSRLKTFLYNNCIDGMEL
jgi:prophage maintenance system killer protein